MLEQLNIHMQKMNLDPYFILYTKINTKLTIDLNAKPKVTKALDEIRREHLCGLRLGTDFFRCDTKSMNYKGKKIIWTEILLKE